MAGDSYSLETVRTKPNGMAPNSRFPVLIYRAAMRVERDADPAEAIIGHFRQHDWLNNWR